MRKITTRERVFLGIGALVAIGIFVYFIFWPMLQSKQSGSKTSLKETQKRLELVKKLGSMESSLIGLKKRMRSNLGYGEMSFKRGIADSTIIKYLAQAAAQAEIKDIDQLDAKPDTSKHEAKSEQAILKSVVDQLYLCQVLDEVKREKSAPSSSAPGEAKNTEQSPSNQKRENPPSPPFMKGGENVIPPFEKGGKAVSSSSEKEGTPSAKVEKVEPASPSEKSSTGETPELSLLLFPPVPKDIPSEVKQLLAKSIDARQGQTTGLADVSNEIKDEKEKERVERRLRLYKGHVKKKKDEVLQWLSEFGISQSVKMDEKVGKFSVKMVFKSRIDQLVKFLYNLQTSAKWLKVESMQVSISDRKQALLSVELSMTATTLYD